MRVDAIVRLCVNKVAVSDGGKLTWVVCAGKLKDRLTAYAVSISSHDGDGRAEKIAGRLRIGDTSRGKIVELRAQTQAAVANLVVPLCRRLIVPGSAVVRILCFLCSIVRNPIQE